MIATNYCTHDSTQCTCSFLLSALDDSRSRCSNKWINTFFITTTTTRAMYVINTYVRTCGLNAPLVSSSSSATTLRNKGQSARHPHIIITTTTKIIMQLVWYQHTAMAPDIHRRRWRQWLNSLEKLNSFLSKSDKELKLFESLQLLANVSWDWPIDNPQWQWRRKDGGIRTRKMMQRLAAYMRHAIHGGGL